MYENIKANFFYESFLKKNSKNKLMKALQTFLTIVATVKKINKNISFHYT